MPKGKSKEYSDQLLVSLIAQAAHSYAEIGRRVGLSEGHVARIARGKRRMDLQDRIREARQAKKDLALEQAARWLKPLLMQHISVGMTGTGDTARRCREFVMDMLGLGPRPSGKRLVTEDG